MNNERDDALSSANCPNCHAPAAMPTAPFPPQKDGGKTDDPNFNACKECGMLYSDMAIALKNVARDEPSAAPSGSPARMIATVIAVIGAIATAWFIYAGNLIGIEVAGVITILAVLGIFFAKKPERGSRRASGMANDQ
jgi:hypothetical protein